MTFGEISPLDVHPRERFLLPLATTHCGHSNSLYRRFMYRTDRCIGGRVYRGWSDARAVRVIAQRVHRGGVG